ncbi:olfactory receptor CB1 isoform X1 [Lepisosteus oculatus]|uniref:olfactory receptor CB1 isoform X1 n=1 Tax=Lepisosteus oculatus TaxID=7918 RepID=UPI0035F508C8
MAMPSGLCWAVLLVSLLASPGLGCDYSLESCGAHADGDILLGMLLPFHAKVDNLQSRTEPTSFNCTEFDSTTFVRSLVVIHSIEAVNAAGFLPGVRLGYIACDTCGHGAKAIQATQLLLSVNGTGPRSCDYSQFRPRVKAIIGSRFSEESIAVARLLGLYLVPQVSSTSSAEILSDKLSFPAFLRTIPSDVHQTRALARLVAHHGWDWVGVVSGDDEYGRAALQSFLANAAEQRVCVAFHEVLPHYLGHEDGRRRVREVAGRIRHSEAQVVLLILKPELVEQLFRELVPFGVNRTWIASDSWAVYQPLTQLAGINQLGDIFGFSFVTGRIPGFEEFLRRLQPRPGEENRFLEEYLRRRGPDDDALLGEVGSGPAYSTQLAVWAVAHALRSLLRCNATACPGPRDFRPWELLRELKRVNFTLDDRRFYFDESGDSVNGYDLIYWARNGTGRRFQVVGKYHLAEREVEVDRSLIQWSTPNGEVPVSHCSQPCPPGTAKKVSNIFCCYNCTPCVEGTYSNSSNADDCAPCPSGTWSLAGSAACRARDESYLRWDEAYAVAMLACGALGLAVLLAILGLFLAHRHTPAVKVAGGPLCYAMLAALAASFGSVALFIGRPDPYACQVRQPLYGLSFTLCVSCILVKAFRTYLAFLFDLGVQQRLKKLYRPGAILLLLTAVQGAICAFWLIFDGPRVEHLTAEQSMTVLVQCVEGSNVGFGIMLSYIGLLAFACFMLAFKSRKIPHWYNETGYIIFSMLVYLFVWVCFVPVYVTRSQQRAAVQASAILASNYGVVCCHLLPKCYFVLFKRAQNTPEAYQRKVRESIVSLDASALSGSLACSARSLDFGLVRHGPPALRYGRRYSH